MRTPVIAIFDVGKTNKKLFLFDEQYQIVYEKTARFTETIDEDGDPCENLDSLRLSVFDSLRDISQHKDFEIRAINLSTYGASFVYIDENGQPLTPLYNYLKVYPELLRNNFYARYGGDTVLAHETASPVLGSLNSGLQLYRLQQEQPEIFSHVNYALHLPQYMSYLLTGVASTDLTSVGCHTHLWNFREGRYHRWVEQEGILSKLAPLRRSDEVFQASFPGSQLPVGVGLHDSSAALIPYLVSFEEPFVLLSTGTWSISLNPFNHDPLTTEELKQDCLCYLSYKGSTVKASRLFAGYEYEQEVRRIAEHFQQHPARYRSMDYDHELALRLKELGRTPAVAGERDLSVFENDTEAYHQWMIDLVQRQYQSTQLVLGNTGARRVFVDGGFSKNAVFMNLLAAAFPGMEVYAASMAQATAAGAALAIHDHWNQRALPNDLIRLNYYAAPRVQAGKS